MTPCHRPSQKPAGSCPVPAAGFGPAAHDARSTVAPRRTAGPSHRSLVCTRTVYVGAGIFGCMAMVIDPVCGMRIDTEDAVAAAEHEGTTYYFCSEACHAAFLADPRTTPEAPEAEPISEADLADRVGTS